MESISHCFRIFMLLLLGAIFGITLADVSSDVKYLRKQYNAGKNEANNFIIQYNGKQVLDEDVLKREDTQTAPTVQINLKTDPQVLYFTFLAFHHAIFLLSSS